MKINKYLRGSYRYDDGKILLKYKMIKARLKYKNPTCATQRCCYKIPKLVTKKIFCKYPVKEDDKTPYTQWYCCFAVSMLCKFR